MPGTATYTPPISRTMDHNVNVIVNDNKTSDEGNKSLKPQNKNIEIPLLSPWISAAINAEIQNTAQLEEKEDDVLYDNIDTKQSSGLKITWRPWTGIYDIELFFHGLHLKSHHYAFGFTF